MARTRVPAMLVLVALTAAVAHESTYRMGLALGGDYQEAMAAAGHAGYWPALLAALAGGMAVLGIVTLRELRRLSARAHATGRIGVADEGAQTLTRIAGPIALRLFLLTAAAFVLQENVERIAAGLSAPGLDALATHGMAPLVFIASAALAVGLVAALMCWRRHVLLARLAASKRWRPSRAPARQRAAFGSVARVGPDVVSSGGSRAPPLPRPDDRQGWQGP